MRWFSFAAQVVAAGALLVLGAGCRDRDTVGIDDPSKRGGDGTVTPPVDPVIPVVPVDPPPGEPIDRQPTPNPIPAENTQPGFPGWRGGRNANEGQVELYTSLESAMAGQKISVKVSASTPQKVTAEIFRVGWYGGAGARRIWTGGPFDVSQQRACPRDPATALVECDWTDTFSFTVDPSWVSGLYAIKVTRPDGYRRFAPFVVRDARAAEVLLSSSLNNSVAYNAWGGESLYYDGSGTMKSARAFAVSYNRPFRDDDGLGKNFKWEAPLAQFLERHGYDVTYAANLDFLRYNNVLEGISAMVHGAQDEYWATAQRTQVDAGLASGKMSLAYFGGNGGYWRVRAEPDAKGAPLRNLHCYKNDVALDPQPGSTVRFRDEPNAHPESLLFGSMYDGWQLVMFPLVVKNPSHWLLEGTGLRAGERLTALVGFEFDRVFEPELTAPGTEIILESPAVTAEGIPNRAHAVARTLPSGTVVFSAGTIYWSKGLTLDPETGDGRVGRMTLNVMEKLLAHRRAPRALPAPEGTRPVFGPMDGRWAQEVSHWAGVAGREGYRDGPAANALFFGPTGLAELSGGALVAADTNNNRIRLIGTDEARTVSTLAGNGSLGLRDGAGAQAMFRKPTGVAVGPDGAIYVADSDNHNIRKLVYGATGWTVSTWAGGPRQGGTLDAVGTQARFRRPTALAIDGAGNLFVADQGNNRIRRIDAITRAVTTMATEFNNPSGVAIGSTGELYVIDAGNYRLARINRDGSVDTVFGGEPGFVDGTGEQARFRGQLGIAATNLDEVLIADTANFRIRKVLPGSTQAATGVFTIAGSGNVGTMLGTGDQADLVAPAGIALRSGGPHFYVSDSFNSVIRRVVR